MVQALIAFGSNMDKERNVAQALAALRAHPSWHVLHVSPVYETAAMGRTGQPSGQAGFYNGALLLETELSAQQLRTALRQLEAAQGRVRSADKFAPRPIDLDIALYGEQVLDVDGSPIPDPDILHRAHVAIPLADIAPDWVHPVCGVTLSQIAQSLHQVQMERLEQ